MPHEFLFRSRLVVIANYAKEALLTRLAAPALAQMILGWRGRRSFLSGLMDLLAFLLSSRRDAIGNRKAALSDGLLVNCEWRGVRPGWLAKPAQLTNFSHVFSKRILPLVELDRASVQTFNASRNVAHLRMVGKFRNDLANHS
jgi:hypothetical protein